MTIDGPTLLRMSDRTAALESKLEDGARTARDAHDLLEQLRREYSDSEMNRVRRLVRRVQEQVIAANGALASFAPAAKVAGHLGKARALISEALEPGTEERE